MAYPIDKKMVVGISSSALFNSKAEDKIFNEQGLQEYKKHQSENKNTILNKGTAFPFVKRFLNINKVYNEEKPVEVVLLSKNSPEAGIRIFNSIKHYDLDITRAAFLNGNPPYKYINAYNISLFLSTNDADVKEAINSKLPAGKILQTNISDDDNENELRIAFDFDGVIVDDESEKIYKASESLIVYHKSEEDKQDIELNPGPLGDFFKKISYFQKLEHKKADKDKDYKKILNTAIITARNAPAHARAINTLKKWEVDVDEMFLLGGIDKSRILNELRPHVFFDDQEVHLNKNLTMPLVHIPFGIAND